MRRSASAMSYRETDRQRSPSLAMAGPPGPVSLQRSDSNTSLAAAAAGAALSRSSSVASMHNEHASEAPAAQPRSGLQRSGSVGYARPNRYSSAGNYGMQRPASSLGLHSIVKDRSAMPPPSSKRQSTSVVPNSAPANAAPLQRSSSVSATPKKKYVSKFADTSSRPLSQQTSYGQRPSNYANRSNYSQSRKLHQQQPPQPQPLPAQPRVEPVRSSASSIRSYRSDLESISEGQRHLAAQGKPVAAKPVKSAMKPPSMPPSPAPPSIISSEAESITTSEAKRRNRVSFSQPQSGTAAPRPIVAQPKQAQAHDFLLSSEVADQTEPTVVDEHRTNFLSVPNGEFHQNNQALSDGTSQEGRGHPAKRTSNEKGTTGTGSSRRNEDEKGSLSTISSRDSVYSDAEESFTELSSGASKAGLPNGYLAARTNPSKASPRRKANQRGVDAAQAAQSNGRVYQSPAAAAAVRSRNQARQEETSKPLQSPQPQKGGPSDVSRLEAIAREKALQQLEMQGQVPRSQSAQAVQRQTPSTVKGNAGDIDDGDDSDSSFRRTRRANRSGNAAAGGRKFRQSMRSGDNADSGLRRRDSFASVSSTPGSSSRRMRTSMREPPPPLPSNQQGFFSSLKRSESQSSFTREKPNVSGSRSQSMSVGEKPNILRRLSVKNSKSSLRGEPAPPLPSHSFEDSPSRSSAGFSKMTMRSPKPKQPSAMNNSRIPDSDSEPDILDTMVNQPGKSHGRRTSFFGRRKGKKEGQMDPALNSHSRGREQLAHQGLTTLRGNNANASGADHGYETNYTSVGDNTQAQPGDDRVYSVSRRTGKVKRFQGLRRFFRIKD